jgi:hypothetical protein
MLPAGWQPCSSTAIHAFCYLPAESVLQIAYVSGRQAYDFPCSPEMFAQFQAAASKGSFVERVMRPYARERGWSRPSYAWPW